MSISTRRDPATQLRVITPSDSTILAPYPRSIYVAVGGDVAILGVDDTVAVVLPAVPSGVIIPVNAQKIMSTGTTATGLIGLS